MFKFVVLTVLCRAVVSRGSRVPDLQGSMQKTTHANRLNLTSVVLEGVNVMPV
jgi:hypothetical protein